MSNYNLFDKILHKQFLQNNNLSNYLYERILNNSKKSQVDINGENIFITGLARSGTTALLNKIYSSGEFGSLLYRFMPFILIPELASKFYRNKLSLKKNKQERFHKDGILININSPECLDEVFWIKALGKYKYRLSKGSYLNLKSKRSIYVCQNIKKGGKFSKNNIKVVRPSMGLHPKYYNQILGKKVNKDLFVGQRVKIKYIK